MFVPRQEARGYTHQRAACRGRGETRSFTGHPRAGGVPGGVDRWVTYQRSAARGQTGSLTGRPPFWLKCAVMASARPAAPPLFFSSSRPRRVCVGAPPPPCRNQPPRRRWRCSAATAAEHGEAAEARDIRSLSGYSKPIGIFEAYRDIRSHSG